MGFIAKDKNMNTYQPTNVSVKQGYLHIKRERSSSPVASRVLFKPWQQAYFILRRDPFVMEEYKDATLKTQKQLHLVSTIRHVGMVRTSKSQPFAFEVVIKEDTALLFGCENQILREEWIGAFMEVKNAVGGQRKSSPQSSIHSHHALLERKGSLNDTYRVGIVDSSLARANELTGDYFLTMTPSRMSLLAITDLNEILSWPMNNVTYYTHQPQANQVILIMSRLCHFGNGKLIFESKQYEQLLRCIEVFHTKNRMDSPKLRSFGSNHSNNSRTSSSYGSSSFSDRSPLNLSCDEDQSVFESQINYPMNRIPENEKTRSSTYPGINDTDNALNMHMKLRRTEVRNHSDSVDSKHSTLLSKQNFENTHTAGSNQDTNFAEITPEEGYVLPNGTDTSDNKHTMITRKESPSRSPNGSDNETDVSSSYLQIVDNESVDDPEAKRILEEINSTLTDPVNNPSCLSTMNNMSMKCQRTNSTGRRSSEPPKSLCAQRSFDKDSIKFSKNPKKMTSHSLDCAPGDLLSKSFNSPLLPRFNKTNAFPKQHSISQGNHGSVYKVEKNSGNPFDKLESFFMKHPRSQVPLSQSFNGLPISKHNFALRRNNTESVLSTPIRSPGLDRNTKPKSFGKSLDIPKVTPELSIDTDNDEPPPVPERTSPKPFQNNKRRPLQREQEIQEEDSESDAAADDITSCNKSSDESDILNMDNKKDHVMIVNAPPLPPKAKLLTPTKSAPIPARLEGDDISNSLSRCSSLGVRPQNIDNNDELTNVSFNGPIMVKTEKQDIESIHIELTEDNEENKDTPPEVPCRQPIHPLAKRKHLSTSEGNLLKSSSVRSFRKVSGDNNNTISHSVEQLENTRDTENSKNTINKVKLGKVNSARRITIHEFDLEAPICDEGLLSVCPIKPKAIGMKSLTSLFPKPPKKLF